MTKSIIGNQYVSANGARMHVTVWAINAPRYTRSHCARQNFWRCYLSITFDLHIIYIYMYINAALIYIFTGFYKDIYKHFLWYQFVPLWIYCICIGRTGQYWPEVSIKYIYIMIIIYHAAIRVPIPFFNLSIIPTSCRTSNPNLSLARPASVQAMAYQASSQYQSQCWCPYTVH